ncbi:major facilitator superfamily domain-containing protein [Talaromyces proteolyticus]|uniref:Major facilitator superfamily domain-containing protein n=1 Tax=Talaromyces proteolyticus TaxID=1131652 RepID=A0AAD4L4R7_9EURO|nr:major facilitator superfamily domain-containing protein [Talaromyces proteolyticus]KAH8705878.1 major facilitator superfamily domain-containing protein [Talaromyces proteolyticus]
MVMVGSFASFFSPLSSSIYFPALDSIAVALHRSTSDIDLTITTYLIMQGIAPMLIAGFSDKAGRRPAYIICFTIYLAANLGLSLQNSYAALMVLRCLQSAGSSGTVALANGLVGDMISASERGAYIAFASVGSMLGPSLSPIIGGLISQYLDWHWIFWFLLIFSGTFFAFLLLLLPETCRKVVGDGSIPPPPLNMSLTDFIRHRRRKRNGIVPNPEKLAELRKNYTLRIPSPLPTLRICLDLETGAVLMTTGLMFACFYAVMTGATTSFHNIYHFNNIQTALMYLPIGGGGIVSAFTTGRIVDWNYRRNAKRAGFPILKNVRQDITNFNIEKARLQVALPTYYLSVVTVIAYGWVVGRNVNLAAPIILLFLAGWGLQATSQVLNALMVDLWPDRSAAATAANNLFRCELGAAASAAISPMSAAMGDGWAYTTLGLIAVAASPSLWLIINKGINWRQRRYQKQQKKASENRK